MNPIAAILKKIGILAGILVAGIVVWVLLIYMPAQKKIEKLNIEKARLEEKVRAEISDQQVQFMKNMVDTLIVKLERAEARIYPLNRLLKLGEDIDHICSDFGLKLVTITPDYSQISIIYKEQQEVSELPVSFRVEGQFSQLAEFLDAIPTFPFLMRVNAFNIEKLDIVKDTKLMIELKGAVVLRKERVDEVTNENLNLPNKA